MENVSKENRTRITTKIALLVGVILLAIWSVLGTGASLAWFQDETPVVKNVFNFAEFDIELLYKNDVTDGYAPVKIDTNIFGDEAIYEPNYTQVVYLKVTNIGTIDMKYRLSIDVRSATVARSILGNEIYLPNYLRYGVIFGDAEAVLTRQLAQEHAVFEMADLRFNTYSQWDSVTVAPGESRYVALIVYMPEEIGDEANYRGDAPDVELGITVYAEQLKD